MAEPNPNPPRITEQDKRRFWSHVNKTDACWLWTACRQPGAYRYGLFKTRGPKRQIKAHRAAWFITYGEWPTLHVLHSCDNPSCVRPDHLFLGTQLDNNADRDRKGRQAQGDRTGFRLHPERRPFGNRNGHATHPESFPRGAQSVNAKLTDEMVADIRALHASKAESAPAIASRLGVSKSMIYRCVGYRTYK